MPRFTLEISAQLDNISTIGTPPDYPWYIRLRCGNCGEAPPKPVVICESDEVIGIRGAVVNLKMTCKLCGRVNDVTILEGAPVYTAEQAPDWAPFMRLECRGTEPVAVELADDVPLKMSGTSGFEFEDAVMADGEFYSYDEKENVAASVTEYKSRVVRG